MEYLMYPMKVLRITQGYGQAVDGVAKCTYSHGNQPAALDQGGNDTGADWVYAPCSCIVKRVSAGTYNIVYFQSSEKVRCRDGIDRFVTWRFMHMNDTDFRGIGYYVGKTFKQGERIYREGQKGAPGATHLHSEFGDGQFTGTGCYASGGGSYSINKPLVLNHICWIAEDTVVKNGYGYTWVRLTDTEKQKFDGDSNVATANWATPKSFNSAYRKGKKYTVNASALNIRKGAGTDQAIAGTALKRGTVAMWYGYYTVREGVTWLYVVANGITGFVSKNYLK